MKIGSQTTFCKGMACPSAEILLSYQKKSLSKVQLSHVVLHLNQCDFCRAELHFLNHHKIEDVNFLESTEIPKHLRQLIEAMLKRNPSEFNFFYDDIYEGESIC